MGKRRTRKDKIIAQLRRQVYKKPAAAAARPQKEKMESSLPEEPVSVSASTPKAASLFTYDPLLIRKDLLRTVVWAVLAFSIEIGLYLLWR